MKPHMKSFQKNSSGILITESYLAMILRISNWSSPFFYQGVVQNWEWAALANWCRAGERYGDVGDWSQPIYYHISYFSAKSLYISHTVRYLYKKPTMECVLFSWTLKVNFREQKRWILVDTFGEFSWTCFGWILVDISGEFSCTLF